MARHLWLARTPDPDESLPASVENGELEEADEVVVGELVDEEEPAPPARSGGVSVERVRPVAVPRWWATAGWTVLLGWHSWWVRAWDGVSFGVHRRQIRAAEAAGDREALAEWVDRREAHAHRRQERMIRLPEMLLGLAKTALVVLVAIPVVLLLLSILLWATGAADFGALWRWAGWVIRAVAFIVGIAWWIAVFAAPVVLVVAGYREGKRRDAGPSWLVEPAGEVEGRDSIPDEAAILLALGNLGISKLDKALKEGWRPRIPLPTQRDATGYRTQIMLPMGVTVEDVNNKKKVLAHNLLRHAVEVWPTEPRDQPGVLDLWVADSGSLSGPVPAWPLLKAGSADYFKGVPVAINLRGKPITGRLFEANYAVAGMMGSGKSTLIINLLLGAMLDPLVDIDVFVMADNADYDPMKPRLRTLLTGTGDEVVEACMDTMTELYAELSIRGQALKEHGERAASRRLAEIDARLRPRIMVIDECQAFYLNEELGDRAIETSVKLENAARKYAITIIYATPEASSDSLPRKLIAVTSNRACFAIGDQTSNDAVLGTGSYKAGISAVGLEPRTDESMGDVGTFMAKGFEPKPGLLRGYFVGQKEVPDVVDRALQLRQQAGIISGGVTAARDLLDDLDEVLGADKVRLADVPPMLRRLAPSWLPYQSMTGTSLRDVLVRDYGVRVTNSGNVLRLDPDELRRVRVRLRAGE